MTIPTDAFRRFQAELAALETKSRPPKTPMEQAKEEFLVLRKRYGLTVADVVTFHVPFVSGTRAIAMIPK